MTVKKAQDEHRDAMRKERPSPERCERQSEECQRTFWIAELFVPGHVWEAINLCEQIKNFGIESVMRDHGDDPMKVIEKLAKMLNAILDRQQ